MTFPFPLMPANTTVMIVERQDSHESAVRHRAYISVNVKDTRRITDSDTQ